jgi:SAM-dependent methyltransferase/uncharacterized protein YbaR (Trm112 family)
MTIEVDDLLACPLHRIGLVRHDTTYRCPRGCSFPIILGIPFLLPRDIAHTHAEMSAKSFALADKITRNLAETDEMKPESSAVDSFVQDMVVNTNSNLYRPLRGRLERYPIPDFPLAPQHSGARLLDIGCGWGRWCVAAARRGFLPIGIDPSLESILAAKRVAAQLGIKAAFVVGDARYLPFRAGILDAAFSYSVLQHLSRDNVLAAIRSLARTLRPGAITKLHLLNRYGLRSLQVQMFRLCRDARGFETRYWRPTELVREFSGILGPSLLEIDGFFTQGRYEDRHLFRMRHRILVEASHVLTLGARQLRFLTSFADNLFVTSRIERDMSLANSYG